MDKQIKTEWVAALRSGEFNQGYGRLRRADGFCCLGVLCEILKDRVGLLSYENDGDTVYDGKADYLPLPVLAKTGIPEENPSVQVDAEFVREWDTLMQGCIAPKMLMVGESQRLATLNDSGATFDMIAGLIERQL